MIESYNTGIDLYSKMASEVYNVPYELCMEFNPNTGELQKEGKTRRTSVKSLLLGIMYSRGAKSIGEQLGISEKEAQKLIDDFYKSFPKVQELERFTKLGATQNGYVTTLFGSKRRLPEVKSRDKWVKARAERQCLNAVIQGTGALLLKLAMLEVHKNEELKSLGGHILMTIHDEQVLEVPKENALRVADILSESMKSVCVKHLGLVQKCDVEFMYHWGESIQLTK